MKCNAPSSIDIYPVRYAVANAPYEIYYQKRPISSSKCLIIADLIYQVPPTFSLK